MLYLWTNYYHKTRRFIAHQNHLIHYDNLTLLPNRRLFITETKELIENHQEFYMGFGDLDNFKNINDVLGHSVGDQYLIFLSEHLKRLINKSLRIYRWGGDEFIFIFLDNDRQSVIKNVDRIFDIFKTPFDINGSKHQISISIGLVHYPNDSDNLDDLVRRADIVMYDIKAHYKNTYSFFEEEYLEELYKVIHFQQELDQYNISDFHVYFQPIIDIQTSKIVGFEALSRLFDTHGEPFNTGAIIKQYEKDGTITNLDKHVFHQACLSLTKLHKAFGKQYFITFNISPLSLNYDYIEYLRRTARSYHIDTSYIIIEIIETLGFKDVAVSVELLNEIKKLGFRIAMDDFGIGYSSLSYIAKLPLDIIKIDRTFIQTYESDAFNRTILNTIQDISDSLHLQTLVEGIETQKQLDFVRTLGVEFYQGYLHSKPQPFEDILSMLENKRSK
jgi:diguanylate cyclase (GGDEF)-like protein